MSPLRSPGRTRFRTVGPRGRPRYTISVVSIGNWPRGPVLRRYGQHAGEIREKPNYAAHVSWPASTVIPNPDEYLVICERAIRSLGAPQLRPVPETSDRRSIPGYPQHVIRIPYDIPPTVISSEVERCLRPAIAWLSLLALLTRPRGLPAQRSKSTSYQRHSRPPIERSPYSPV